MKLKSHLWPVLIGIALVFSINTIEHMFMPVVKDFVVQEISQTDDKITLQGWMRKDRNCSFAGIIAEGKDFNNTVVDVELSFRDGSNHNATRPVGTQSWGPWTIELPVYPSIKEVRLSSVHRCHPAWTTTTQLIDINLQDEDVLAKSSF